MSLTKQEMFDRAYRGLAKQRWERSVDELGGCRYNGPNGMHCAWGHVDPSVPSRKEGNDLTTLRRMKTGVARTLSDDDFEFAREMQETHDTCGTPDEMRRAFRSLAKFHHLKIPTVRK